MSERELAAANRVHLVGRFSGEAQERVLPSGDKVVSFRVVVPREDSGADTIDCAAWSGRARRTALSLRPDQVISIEGALRRRFFRAGGSLASRYEVEASLLTRL